MPTNLPTSPAHGDTYTVNGRDFIYNRNRWQSGKLLFSQVIDGEDALAVFSGISLDGGGATSTFDTGYNGGSA